MTTLRLLALPLSVSLLLLPRFAAAAPSGDIRVEYEQVHKIALRDPRVRDAYARANERLDARIVELDPALAGYVRTHPSVRGELAVEAPAPRAHAPVAPRRPEPAPAPAAAPLQTHVVAQGETLSAIATRYGVSVASLESANHIQDARKLQVGQTLTIPAAGSAPKRSAVKHPGSASNAPVATPAPDSFWDKMKKGMN